VPLQFWLCYCRLQDLHVLVEIGFVEVGIIVEMGVAAERGIAVERCNCGLRGFNVIVFLAPPLRYLRSLVNGKVRDERFCFLIEDDVFAGRIGKQFPNANPGRTEFFRGFQPCQAVITQHSHNVE